MALGASTGDFKGGTLGRGKGGGTVTSFWGLSMAVDAGSGVIFQGSVRVVNVPLPFLGIFLIFIIVFILIPLVFVIVFVRH